MTKAAGRSFVAALAAALAVASAYRAFGAVVPQYHFALDGDAKCGGRYGASVKPAVVYGAAKWEDGVSGKALNVTRHAYDQVTALVSEPLPNVSTRRGTFSFWFKPSWDMLDGERHFILSGRSTDWRTFRFYMTKGKNGVFEFSFVQAKQIQFLLRDVFKKDDWAHVAFTWNSSDGSVCLYVNGKLLGRKADEDAFAVNDESVGLVFQCGDGTDRFKAVVGDGLYDDMRIYNKELSPESVFILATGDTAVQMKKTSPPAGDSILLKHAEAALPSAAPVYRFATSGGATFTLTAMGASRQLSLAGVTEGASSVVSGADTLDLRTGYTLSFVPRGKMLVFYVDGARQGRIKLDRDIGKIVSAEIAEGVSIGQPRVAKVSRPDPASAAEAPLWTLDDAARRTNGVRRAVSLNGYWRVWPVDDYTTEVPSAEPGYMRVPGSFRSPLWAIHKLGGPGKPDNGAHSWNRRGLESYRAAWYEREVQVTPGKDAVNGRVWVVLEKFNGDVGRVFWNGELVSSFRQDFKSFAMIPNVVRVDVTDRLAQDGRNVLRLYVDRHYTGLWQGKPAIGDHGETCLGDAWLEFTPGRLHVKTALALPKWRDGKSVTMRVRIANPAKSKGDVTVKATFSRPGADKSFEKKVALAGTAEELVTWTEPWPEAVAWSAEDPQTYSLDVALIQGEGVADTFPRQTFGFREAWVENGEMYLNGVHLRLRMWTNPSLERLRYYYGHPDAIGQYVAHIKELNYDTVRDSPWRNESTVGHFEFLDECDRRGLYVLHQMPTYEDESRNEYSHQVMRFFEAYGGHPSILMWYTDFNTCGYSWEQDPAKLTDVEYDPPSKKLARGRARKAEATMRELDSSRECFQHAGGNMGKIFTSMNYQSYGTPLQEQEDWPAQWAKGHKQPLMVVESGFPYPGQFERFDGAGTKEHLGAEQAARYFGPSAFAAERFPVPHSSGLHWIVDAATGDDPNMSRLSDLHYRRVVRAWRGYDVSAIGDFPGGRDHTHTVQMFNNHCVVWSLGGDPKTPGLKPESAAPRSEVQRHLLADYSRPDYLHGTVKACFAPLLVFVGGDPDDFTNKDHSFFAGEEFRKSLVAVNDHLVPVTLAYAWKCAGAEGSGKIVVPAGGIVREPIELAAPDVDEKSPGSLQVAWRCLDAPGGAVEGRESITLRFFPRKGVVRTSGLPMHLYDPLGKTAELLKRAGVKFETVRSLSDVPPSSRLLIVGQGAFASSPLEGELPQVADVLVFEQPTNSLKRFVMSAPSCRDAFANVANSPWLEGLDDRDLADWRGQSDTVPAFVLSDEHSPHYPRSKWKCGNGGIVSGCAIRRPSRGNFRTIVSCGFNLENAALLEERRECGRTLWCQMDVTSRYGKDPAATLLVDNILDLALSPDEDPAKGPVYWAGDLKDAEVLSRAGAKIPVWDGKSEGTVLVLPGADLSRLPFKYSRGRILDFRAAVPSDAAFSGVAPADCYFRGVNNLPSPTFDVKHYGDSVFVFVGVRPDGSVKGLWNDEKIMRVWSTVLDNAGVRLKAETPYIPKLDLYDGDAFHNW